MKKILIIVSIVLTVFILISSLVSKIVYDKSFPRYDRHDDSINALLRYQDIEDEFPRETHTFLSGKNELMGYTYALPNPHGLVVIAHGIGGGADSYLNYAHWFLQNNWSVFMFDNTGSFDSEGTSTKGFPQSLIDIDAALNFMTQHADFKDLDLVLFGHSWGGYAVSNALHFDYDIKAVVAASSPSNADEMIFEQSERMLGIFGLTQRPFLSIYQRLLFNSYARYDAVDAINQSNAHVMIIHGTEDDMVGYNQSALISKKSEIKNPNTIFITRTEDGKNGHNDLFKSEEALNYINEINLIYKDLYDTHQGQIPYDIKQTFYESVDRFRVQELDEELMQIIHDFYLSAITF